MALQVVLILATLILLWWQPLFEPPAMECGEHPAILYALLCRWFAHLPRLAVVLAILLILAEGIGLNLLLADAGLASQNSLLPTLLYILFISAGTTTLSPIILVSGLAILCLHQLLLHGTLLSISTDKICTVTSLIAIATMFYQPAILLLLTYLLVAANYRLYTARDWALMILGFLAPYLLLLGILYLTDGISDWWHTTMVALTDIPHLSLTSHNTPFLHLLANIFLIAIFLWGLLGVNLRLTQHPVLWQKNASTIMLFTVGALGMMLYLPLLPVYIALFTLPFTFCTTRLFIDATATSTFRKKKHLWAYDILLLFIIAATYLC